MKRLNKLLAAIKKFSSVDNVARYIHGIKFDLNRQTIEATDGHAGIIVKGSKDFIVKMANEYAEYLGLEPVGSDFGNLGIVKLAPAHGKTWPKAERFYKVDMLLKADLHKCLHFDHDPATNNYAHVHNEQFQRLNQFCKAVKVPLKLIPGMRTVDALMQYGKGKFNGEDIYFCIAQMPMFHAEYDAQGNLITTCIRYDSVNEIDKESMQVFKQMA
jgi:hypothetical protein